MSEEKKMKKMLRVPAVLMALCLVYSFAVTAGADQAHNLPTADAVIQRYQEAAGGPAALESLATRVCLGRMVHDLSWKSPAHEVVPFAAYTALPGRVLMVEHKAGGVRCEGSDGTVTWVQDADGITLKDEPFRLKTAWLFDPRNATSIERYFPGLGQVSEKTVDGRKVYVVRPGGLDPAHYELSFDAETGLLVGIGYYWSLEDYRQVDGVNIPHRVVMSRKGGSSTFIIDSIAHNLPLEDKLFEVPGPLK
jgi:hypothetical protein